MLIGQWAQAANITRYYQNRVCMWTNGGSPTSSCGGSLVHSRYCWPKGAKCVPTCSGSCCYTGTYCNTSSGSYPLLCVK